MAAATNAAAKTSDALVHAGAIGTDTGMDSGFITSDLRHDGLAKETRGANDKNADDQYQGDRKL